MEEWINWLKQRLGPEKGQVEDRPQEEGEERGLEGRIDCIKRQMEQQHRDNRLNLQLQENYERATSVICVALAVVVATATSVEVMEEESGKKTDSLLLSCHQ